MLCNEGAEGKHRGDEADARYHDNGFAPDDTPANNVAEHAAQVALMVVVLLHMVGESYLALGNKVEAQDGRSRLERTLQPSQGCP